MITGSINVSLVNKERLYQGKKGKYLNIVLIETPNSEFGDFMICEGITREEREAGKKGTILGNAKLFEKKQARPKSAARPKQKFEQPPDDDGDPVPF